MLIQKLLLTIVLLTGFTTCHAIKVMSESKVSATSEKFQNLVIFVEPNLFHQLEGKEYLEVMKTALEKQLQREGYETRLVEVSVGKIDEGQLLDAMNSLKPSHILRMTASSATTINGGVRDIAWMVEVLQKNGEVPPEERNSFAAVTNAKRSLFSYRRVYTFNMQSEFCVGLIKSLRSQSCANDFAGSVTDVLKQKNFQ